MDGDGDGDGDVLGSGYCGGRLGDRFLVWDPRGRVGWMGGSFLLLFREGRTLFLCRNLGRPIALGRGLGFRMNNRSCV